MKISNEKKPSEHFDVPGTPETGQIHVNNCDNVDGLQRRLNNRQIQLVAIGGSIGTALFVSLGQGLEKGGPGSVLLAVTLYAMVVGCVNNGLAEMNTLMPVSGGFVRLAGHWVDDALGFMAGWNFFLNEALLIPFEISALNLVCSFWSDKITAPGPTAAMCLGVVVLYGLINVIAVRGYGEAEFWLSGGKVFLVMIVFAFAFVTMVGGNPRGDAYGFRNWTTTGAFLEYKSKGSLGRFQGFLEALWTSAFLIIGPEYVSMVSAEAKRPRIYIKTAFKTIYWRFGVFFIGSAIAMGIVTSARDPALVAIANGQSKPGAAASPYVIAMRNLGIDVLPHIVNALLVTSIFSAGNTYTYCAIRSLYGLALDGHAPAFLRKCRNNGVPIYCFLVVMLFPLLSLLAISNGSAQVLTWFISLVTGNTLINYIIINITFICFYNACKVQGLDRRTLPYYGRFQPYCAYIALICHTLILLFFGYTVLSPFQARGFFQNYTMPIAMPLFFIAWKVFKKTRFVPSGEADLVWERPVIDRYEENLAGQPVGFWTEMGELLGIKRKAE